MKDSTKQKLLVLVSTGGGFLSGILRAFISTTPENSSGDLTATSSSMIKTKISSSIALLRQLILLIPVANKSPVNNTVITTGGGLSIGLLLVVLAKFLHKETIQENAQLQAQQRTNEGTYGRVLGRLEPTQQELENLQTKYAEAQQQIRDLEEENSRLSSANTRSKQQKIDGYPHRIPRQRAEVQPPVEIPLSPSLAMAKTG